MMYMRFDADCADLRRHDRASATSLRWLQRAQPRGDWRVNRRNIACMGEISRRGGTLIAAAARGA
jgi:hypothetical protein